MRTDPTTLAALAKVRPGADGTFYVDKDRHPNVYRYATTTRWRALHDNLWRDGYTLYGDEMEKALTTIYGVTDDSRSIHTSLAYALPDPWMLTGHREEELGDDFFLLWSRVKPRELDKAIPLVNSHVPARTRELVAWIGNGPLTLPDPIRKGRSSDASNTPTWARVLARRLRYGERPSFTPDRSLDEHLTAATIADLYEFMDSGIVINQAIDGGSLQEQLAVRRGVNRQDSLALTTLSIAYTQLTVEEMTEYPRTAEFVEGQDWVGNATVAGTSRMDLEKFEAVLDDTDGFSIPSQRHRLALMLEPEEFLCRKLLPEQKKMWALTCKYSDMPGDWMPSVLHTEATAGEVDMVAAWMDAFDRGDVLVSSIPRPWTDFVLFPSTLRQGGRLPEGDTSMRVLCELIKFGASFDEVRSWANRGFTVPETAEVLMHGTPGEYVMAMRPPEPVAPF